MSLKKWIVLFVGIALAFSLAACGSGQQAESNATADSETIQESSPEPGTAKHSGDATSEPEVANETENKAEENKMSKVLVITTSLRAKSNSDILSERLVAGAKDAGHEVEIISLKGKEIKFCIGCLACQKTQKCVLKDDAVGIAEKVKNADTLVFSTPIYYYEMSGQMKTLLDRMNPLYPSDYRFRNVYMLATATEDEETTPEKALISLQGWVDCFEKATLVDSLFCGGISDPGEASAKEAELEEAYNFGKQIK